MIRDTSYTRMWDAVAGLPLDESAKQRLADIVREHTDFLLEVARLQAESDVTWLVTNARFDSHTQDTHAETILERWQER